MQKPIRTDNWSMGANNLARPERLPDGFVRSLTNLDPCEGGQLNLRAGFRRLVDGAVRFAVAIGSRVIYALGTEIGCYSTKSASAAVIGSVVGAGDISAAELNGQVFIASIADSVRTNGEWVKPWAVPAPGIHVEIIDGALPAGIYKVAVTALGSDGEESGADPVIVRLVVGKALRVTSPDQRAMRLYVSVADGATLFSQGPLIAGAMAVTRVRDDLERLTTGGLVSMPACSMLATHRGMILGAYDTFVIMTTPMQPHLVDPVAGYFQFPEAPSLIAPTDGGVYVAAGEKTYFLSGLETAAPSQLVVMEIGAVAGSAVKLPDGRAAWFTRYGLAIGGSGGEITLPNKKTYAPDIAAGGASGVIEHRGNSMIVTTMRGATSQNNLATGDFAELET